LAIPLQPCCIVVVDIIVVLVVLLIVLVLIIVVVLVEDGHGHNEDTAHGATMGCVGFGVLAMKLTIIRKIWSNRFAMLEIPET